MKQNLTELKKSYAELGAEIAKLEAQTPESRFAELVEGYEVKTDWEKWPNWLFFFKEEKLLGEFYLKTQIFYSTWDNLWSVFENEFEMKYPEIIQFMRKQIENHFKLSMYKASWRWTNHKLEVEEHFKSKVN